MGAGGGDIWQDKSKAVVYTSPNMSSHIYVYMGSFSAISDFVVKIETQGLGLD